MIDNNNKQLLIAKLYSIEVVVHENSIMIPNAKVQLQKSGADVATFQTTNVSGVVFFTAIYDNELFKSGDQVTFIVTDLNQFYQVYTSPTAHTLAGDCAYIDIQPLNVNWLTLQVRNSSGDYPRLRLQLTYGGVTIIDQFFFNTYVAKQIQFVIGQYADIVISDMGQKYNTITDHIQLTSQSTNVATYTIQNYFSIQLTFYNSSAPT